MESLRSYILSLVCAASFCGILSGIAGEKGTAAGLRKLIFGIFLCFSVITPLKSLHFEDLLEPIADIREDALATAAMGKTLYQESLSEVITSQAETYILDKAQSLGLTVTVSIQPDDSGKPYRATITGIIPEDHMRALSDILEGDLGIPKERQIWRNS